MKIKLPPEPVDGYTIHFWKVWEGSITECKVVYFANMRWDKYTGKKNAVGADLVDDWMHYAHGVEQGRTPGWANIVTAGFDACFASRKKAVAHAVKTLTADARECEREAKRLRKLAAKLK